MEHEIIEEAKKILKEADSGTNDCKIYNDGFIDGINYAIKALYIHDVVERVIKRSNPNEKDALQHAINAIYFADSSDYLSGLYGVVRSLTGLDEPTEEDIKNLFKELNPE